MVLINQYYIVFYYLTQSDALTSFKVTQLICKQHNRVNDYVISYLYL